MKNLVRLALTIALALGAGPQAWAGFSVDQQPAEVPAMVADPGDTYLFPGLAPEVDDGDSLPYLPSLLVVPGPPGAVPYDTDAFSRDDPNDPAVPAGGAPPGVFFSLDDGDPGPGIGLPDRQTELFFAPFPFVGTFSFTNATEVFLTLLGNPPPTALDDDVDAFETRPVLGLPFGAYFSADYDAPAGLDPGDIYWSPLNGGPFALACDDVTQIMLVPNESTNVDIDALQIIPFSYCAGIFPPGGTACFLFSVDDAPIPPGLDPGDIYITDCRNGFALFADDVTQLGIAPNESTNVDLDALSVNAPGPIAPVPCWDNDGDWFWDKACGGTDCDDMDPNTYPGAAEICDGKDNDCDLAVPANETDDDLPAGDGYVECKPWVGPPGTKGGDCNDTDPNVNPGVVEDTASGNCSDTIDNDCDTLTDSADPGCGGGGCAGSPAAASVPATPDVPKGSFLNLLAFLLVPVAAALGIVVLRRRR